MSSNQVLTISFQAAAALEGGRVVRLTGNEAVNYATTAAHEGVGITNEKGAGNGEQVGVVVVGVAKAEAAASVGRGDRLRATTSGKVTPTTASGDQLIGVALDAAAADGDFIRVLIAPSTR